MKNKRHASIIAGLLALTASSQAATIVWTSNPITGPNDVRPNTSQETTVLANVPVAASAVTVNGIAFATSRDGTGGVNLAITTSLPHSGFDTNNQLGTNISNIDGSTEYKDLLEGALWTMTSSPSTMPTLTFTFTGLTLSQRYEVRVWAVDYRSFGAGRYVSVDGGTTIVDYNATDTANTTTGGGFFTGVFTADSTSQAFTLTGFDPAAPAEAAAQYNALQLVAIPEPSAALLGGLGLLAMLRRRR